jgi:hypothetical protein
MIQKVLPVSRDPHEDGRLRLVNRFVILPEGVHADEDPPPLDDRDQAAAGISLWDRDIVPKYIMYMPKSPYGIGK